MKKNVFACALKQNYFKLDQPFSSSNSDNVNFLQATLTFKFCSILKLNFSHTVITKCLRFKKYFFMVLLIIFCWKSLNNIIKIFFKHGILNIYFLTYSLYIYLYNISLMNSCKVFDVCTTNAKLIFMKPYRNPTLGNLLNLTLTYHNFNLERYGVGRNYSNFLGFFIENFYNKLIIY